MAAGQILPIGTALWLMRLAFGWRYIVFAHGYDVALARRNRWKSWLARRVLRSAYGVVANSNFTKSLAVAAGARSESVRIVYPCADLGPADNQLVNELRARWQLQDKLVVLSVARLVPRKGLADVIAAVAALRAEFPALRYVVAGEGECRSELEQVAKQKNTPVVFTGAVSDRELAACYELCDVFVLTPKEDEVDVEGFGTVYVEAQAHGKPVIGSAVGGVPEAVGEAGTVVHSPAKLTGALRQLLRDEEERRQLGAVGKRRASEIFSWSIQAQKIEQWMR